MENPILKGRIADILWLRGQGFEYAKTAISYFTQYPISESNWHEGSSEVWERTIRMLLKFGKGMQTEFSVVQDKITAVFFSLEYTKNGYIYLKKEMHLCVKF